MAKRRVWRCMAYISVHTKFADIERREERQLHYIREYVKANRIEIAGVVYRHGIGQYEVNRHFESMVNSIKSRKHDGILIVNMSSVSTGIADGYAKIGKVIEAGGHIITVDEGDLRLPLNFRSD